MPLGLKRFSPFETVALYLRVALGTDFLSPVADRFGLWDRLERRALRGAISTISWLTQRSSIPGSRRVGFQPIGWISTVCEICFGVALIIGYRTRLAAVLSGVLTLAFAIGMVFGVGIHAALNYSEFAVSAGAFLLAEAGRYPWSLDGWREKSQLPAAARGRQEHQVAAWPATAVLVRQTGERAGTSNTSANQDHRGS